MTVALVPPAHSDELQISFPENHVLLLTLNRPKSLNAMTPQMSDDLGRALDWFENEPSLWYCLVLDAGCTSSHFFHRRVVIVTGAGRIFCAGADLKALVRFHSVELSPVAHRDASPSGRWNKNQQAGSSKEQEGLEGDPYGFGSISRRQSNKPFIAAVNGGAFGGGTEIVLNCDIVVASHDAKFALPEVKRGVVAAQGGE